MLCGESTHKVENVQKWLSKIKVKEMTSKSPRNEHCRQVAKITQLILLIQTTKIQKSCD